MCWLVIVVGCCFVAGRSGRLRVLQLRHTSEVFRHDPVPLRDTDIPEYFYAALEELKKSELDDALRREYVAKQALKQPRRVRSVEEVHASLFLSVLFF